MSETIKFSAVDNTEHIIVKLNEVGRGPEGPAGSSGAPLPTIYLTGTQYETLRSAGQVADNQTYSVAYAYVRDATGNIVRDFAGLPIKSLP